MNYLCQSNKMVVFAYKLKQLHTYIMQMYIKF